MHDLQGILKNGERVTLKGSQGNYRDLGHGHQLEVFYSDGSTGFEHWEDIQFDNLGTFDFNIGEVYYYPIAGGFIEVSDGQNDNFNSMTEENIRKEYANNSSNT
jgi:hypothetical protein